MANCTRCGDSAYLDTKLCFKHREEARLTSKNWYHANKSRALETTKKWKLDNPEKWKKIHRNNKRKRKYGISEADLLKLIADHDNKCAICQSDFSGSPDVDHSHSTGKVRGLLCRSCNLAIGLFKDDHQLLQRALEYLQGS